MLYYKLQLYTYCYNWPYTAYSTLEYKEAADKE